MRKSWGWTHTRWMVAFGWSLGASVAIAPAATAQSQRIDIPAGPLSRALSQLSARTGVSIGFSGRLPAIMARPVHGATSAADSLRQMLRGTGYRAIATGPSSFRLEAVPIVSATRPVEPSRPSRPVDEKEIVVTALKRSASYFSTPATVRVIAPSSLRDPGGLSGSDALAAEIPSLSISSLGPGRNRLFLRGIGDGPLNGFNQGSVATLLDEARLNYDAPDPDWASVDIDQIEVLEGPQGPLYGTGALGGIVKISTRAPVLDTFAGRFDAGGALTQDGDLSNSQSVVLNLPIVTGRLALRAIAYRQRQAGWVDTIGGARDGNAETLSGGRATLRWVPAEGWTVDFTGALQGRRARDSQYVDGNLGPLERPARVAEPRDLDARLAKLTVKGRIGDLELTSLTALSGQEASATYDATPLAATLGVSGTTVVQDDRDYRLFDQELRLGTAGDRNLNWLVGASLISASTRATIAFDDGLGRSPLLSMKRDVSETAVFGQADVRLTPTLRLEGGGRMFVSRVEDEGDEGGAGRSSGKHSLRGSGSVSLSWSPRRDRNFFVRAATAFRPGGANVQSDARQADYDADELASVEAGARLRWGRSWSIDATAFASRWQHVQADELLANGLIATRNAGNALNFGMEADVRWSPLVDTDLRAGFLVQSARLEKAGAEGVDDPRLPAVPQLALRLRGSQGFRIGDWSGMVDGGIQYVGATHMSFDPTLDRRTPGRVLIDAGVRLENGDWTLGLSGQNLANSTADTFAFGNPYRVRAIPQRTPLRPRTIGLTIGRRF